MTGVVVELQTELRGELKEPMGAVYTDTATLLAEAGDLVFAVGDMVTYHLLKADRTPDLALVDEKTERDAVDDDVTEAIGGFDREVTVANPAATLTKQLLTELREGIDRAGEESTLITVDGEEDLAVLPVVVAAPAGSSVVYGQPGEGMVLVDVDRAAVDRARDLLSRMNGDTERLWTVLKE